MDFKNINLQIDNNDIYFLLWSEKVIRKFYLEIENIFNLLNENEWDKEHILKLKIFLNWRMDIRVRGGMHL